MSDDIIKPANYDDLLEEVEDRLDDLEYEIGDDAISKVKIYEKLRDEFKGDDYKQVLIDLGVNASTTGLKQVITTTPNNSIINRDEKGIDTLVKILLNPQDHIQRTEKRLRGWEEESLGQWKKKREYMIPSREVVLMVQFLESIYLPQNIVSKKNLSIAEFDSSMNLQLNKIRVRLENYPDKIVKPGVITFATTILLNEVQVIKNAIETGRLGDIAENMIIGSHNETIQPQAQLKRDDILNALTGTK